MRTHCIFIVILLIVPFNVSVKASNIQYDVTTFSTIQEMIDSSHPGDTLLIPSGYYMGSITIDKPLTLIGTNNTYLFTQNSTIITIKSSSVSIKNIQFLYGQTAISVEMYDNVNITQCSFIENAVGIDIRGGSDYSITQNNFINNVACGAILQNIENASLVDNFFNFKQPDNWINISNIVTLNSVENRIGVKIIGVINITVSNNQFVHIKTCTYLGNSQKCILKYNTFKNTTTAIDMRDSTYNIIEYNEGYETNELVKIWLSSFNNITENYNNNNILSLDIDSNNRYQINDLIITGLNFILEIYESKLDPIFYSLSDAIKIVLIPDPITASTWVEVQSNITNLHNDAIPESIGLYDTEGNILCKSNMTTKNTILKYRVLKNNTIIYAKKVDVEPPTANAGKNKTGKIYQSLIFDASNSTDNIEIKEYHWDFGDGTESYQKISSHLFNESGLYEVKLVIKDVGDNFDEDTIRVTIEVEVQKENKGNSIYLVVVLLLLIICGILYLRARKKNPN